MYCRMERARERVERFMFVASPEELSAIEEFRLANRMPNRCGDQSTPQAGGGLATSTRAPYFHPVEGGRIVPG